MLIPFRWIELSGWHGELKPSQIYRRASFDNTWSDKAAEFRSSDSMLNQVWQLCHYSVKATTFAGVFVDGDRERIAYEADAYLNQLDYYAGDADPRMPRATFERLLRYPTWPSEWPPHLVLMAYADWMETGDRQWLSAHYEGLKGKLLQERLGKDGLIESSAQQMRRGDLVDWPPDERDGFVFTSKNSVVNAFRLRALREMTVLAQALGKQEEAAAFQKEYASSLAAFQKAFLILNKGFIETAWGQSTCRSIAISLRWRLDSCRPLRGLMSHHGLPAEEWQVPSMWLSTFWRGF